MTQSLLKFTTKLEEVRKHAKETIFSETCLETLQKHIFFGHTPETHFFQASAHPTPKLDLQQD
jgi:hypothetical protein